MTMKQLPVGLIDRIGLTSRLSTRYDRPRDSIYDQVDDYDQQDPDLTEKRIRGSIKPTIQSIWPNLTTKNKHRSNRSISSTSCKRVSSTSSSNDHLSQSSSTVSKPLNLGMTIIESSEEDQNQAQTSYSSNDLHHHHHLSGNSNSKTQETQNRSVTPLAGPRSTSAMSHVSFRSMRSISSRMRVRIKSFGQVLEIRKSRTVEFDWSDLRSEYESHLARGSIVERCLVEVDVGDQRVGQGKWWIDSVWTLADRLSPPIPAVLAQYSATGLLPLLNPLRNALRSLENQLPYDINQESIQRFERLSMSLTRALWYSQLIESVIEVVGRSGLVKFELIGLSSLKTDETQRVNVSKDKDDTDEGVMKGFRDQLLLEEDLDFEKVCNWKGEIRCKTAGGQPWRGIIKTQPMQ